METEIKTRAVEGIVLATLLSVVTLIAAHAADEIRAGKWQFTTQMQLPAVQQSAAGAQGRPGSSSPMTPTACIDAADLVPADAHCTLDKENRRGGVVTWAMTCISPQGPIQSAGWARYTGDTMEGTLTAREPGPNGQPVDAPGRIRGSHIGPSDAK
jgi:hypothetical protein